MRFATCAADGETHDVATTDRGMFALDDEPPQWPKPDDEGEVVAVTGKGGRRIPAENAYDHVAALTMCKEGAMRDWIRRARFNVTHGKNWGNSGAIGPRIAPFTVPAQLDDARIITRVNGEIRQEDALARTMVPTREGVAYISTFTTLQPGDMIVTGTPTGAGARFGPPKFLPPGDVVEVEAAVIGILRNTVQDEVQDPSA